MNDGAGWRRHLDLTQPFAGSELPRSTGIELQDYPIQSSKSHPTADRHTARRHRKRLVKLERLVAAEEMKFSHSIQFNAVPDWSSNYIAYSNLKKSIYTLEKQVHQTNAPDGGHEEEALLDGQRLDPDVTFKRLLDSELEKVCSFYRLKEMEIFSELEHIQKDIETYQSETAGVDMDEVVDFENRRKVNRSSSIFGNVPFKRRRRASTMSMSITEEQADDSDSDADDNAAMLKKKDKSNVKQRSKSVWQPPTHSQDLTGSRESLPTTTSSIKRRPSMALELDSTDPSHFASLYDSGITLKKRIINVYVSLSELRSFIQLNQTGFKKVAKKYDKVCDRDIRKEYLEKSVDPSYPFRDSTMTALEANITRAENEYAEIVTKERRGPGKARTQATPARARCVGA